ncbi:MAG: Ig domain-containing protein [Pirellulales bacterium]
MNQREKTLASLVAVLVISLGGYYIYGSYQSSVTSRQKDIDRLEKKIKDEEFKEAKAQMAMQRLELYREHALPEDSGESQAFYQKRLREELDRIGFIEPKMDPSAPKRRGSHNQHSFTVSADGTLTQLTEFCHNFYSLQLMHKITGLTVTPNSNSDLIKINMSIEVLGIDGVTETPNPESIHNSNLLYGELEDYKNKIVSRNFFGPANEPPVFTSLTSHKAEQNEIFRYSIKAKDPDQGDRLKFYLGDNAPEGLAISESTGSLTWTPEELGDYKFLVTVKDDSTPPKFDEKEFAITVIEPIPKPEPVKRSGFDDAEQAFLTAITLSNNVAQVSLNLRTQGKVLRLGIGDEFSVGTIKGKISAIHLKQIEIEIDGETVAVALGDNLGDAKTISEGEL